MITVEDAVFSDLDKLAAQVAQDKKEKTDFLASPRSLALSDDAQTLIAKMGTKSAGFSIRPIFHRQLGDDLGIPAKYYDKCLDQPKLLADNVNTWLQQAGPKQRRMLRAIRGQMRAYLSDAYKITDNEHLFDEVIPELRKMKGIRIPECAITESKMYIKIFIEGKDWQADVKLPGGGRDIVRAGLMLSTSEIGMGATTVTPMLRRDLCGNNLLAYFGKFRAFHVGARHEDLGDYANKLSHKTKQLEALTTASKVKDMVKAALSKEVFHENLAMIEGAQHEKMTGEEVAPTIEILRGVFNLREEETKQITGALIENGDLTRWGLVNAVTQTARDMKKQGYDRATDLEEIGGRLLGETITVARGRARKSRAKVKEAA